MSPIQRTHLDREDRKSVKDQLDWSDLRLSRAEEGIHLAKRLEGEIEIERRGQIALDEAWQLIEGKERSHRTSNPLTVPNRRSLALNTRANDLEQILDNSEANLDFAQIHNKAASVKLQGKLTPTALVSGFNTRAAEQNGKIDDLSKSVREIKTSQRIQRNLLTRGREEE
jgi:hypothetical protein